MKYQINLFPAKEQTTADKIIYFSFHYLRYILVITQFVVICVFFYRFKVDQDIVDLKDTLQQKQEIVALTKTLMTEVDTLDKKVGNIKQVMNEQIFFNDLYTYFFSHISKNITISKLQIADNSVECEGVTSDPNVVKDLYENLQKEKRFKTVDLQNVRKIETGYSFSLSLQNFISTTK